MKLDISKILCEIFIKLVDILLYTKTAVQRLIFRLVTVKCIIDNYNL